MRHKVHICAIVVMLLATSTLAGAKDKDKARVSVPGDAMIWADPGDVSAKDLYWGIGSPEGVPKPPFTFLKEDFSGTKPKVHVTDANGVRWNVKLGSDEVHAEVAASRITWALGFMVEESYYVDTGRIDGMRSETLKRAGRAFRPDGSFVAARFEKRPDHIERLKINWTWDQNPFVGSKEISGLKLLAVMVNNWDVMPKNNNVLAIRGADGSVRTWYLIADWGQTFGRMGSPQSHSKWVLQDYKSTPFVLGTSGDTLKLHFEGYTPDLFRNIPIEHARWFAGLVSQLSDAQLRDAFRAGGARPADAEAFAARFREKVDELKAAVGGATVQAETRPRRTVAP